MRFHLLIVALFAAAWLGFCTGGGLDDVEHIIIFMQENRAFDHYFGRLAGVRGFDDRAAPPLPNGRPPFYQPMQKGNDSNYQLPYHIDMIHTSASCMSAPTMSYPCDTSMWNHGKMDSWNTARDPGYGLGYFEKEDLPYYYTLADAFILGDQYYQASFTQTNPNRLFLFTASNGPSAIHGQPAILDNTEPDEGFAWDTIGEILERNNITWKVYQEEDNFDDNAFAWFTNYKKAQPGSPLYDKGIAIVPDLCSALASDMENGKLPSVSIIVGPTALSEHATNHPAAGEDLSARLIKVLQNHPEVYKKSIFILNYDEGGQFYDHHWTPTPPSSSADGISTVDVSNEIVNYNEQLLPIGLGFRVPLIIVSPWTRNGGVISQVLSHTSVGLLLEKKFNITITAMSEWRRTITGDLLAAFDWDHPDYSWPIFPDTSSYVNDSNYQCDHYPRPIIPTQQSIPHQYSGIKSSRTLPYSFSFTDTIINNPTNLIKLLLENTGKAGAAFQLYNWQNLDTPLGPRKYTISEGKNIDDNLSMANDGSYQYSLHGPNGWVRYFAGVNTSIDCIVSVSEDVSNGYLILKYSNMGLNSACSFQSIDNAYNNGGPWSFTVYPTKTVAQKISVSQSGNWYDITVDVIDKSSSSSSSSIISSSSNNNNNNIPLYQRRFMGRIERPGCTSDPAVGNGLINFSHPSSHPPNSPYNFSKENNKKRVMRSKSSRIYDRHRYDRNNKDQIRCWNQPFDKCKDDL